MSSFVLESIGEIKNFIKYSFKIIFNGPRRNFTGIINPASDYSLEEFRGTCPGINDMVRHCITPQDSHQYTILADRCGYHETVAPNALITYRNFREDYSFIQTGLTDAKNTNRFARDNFKTIIAILFLLETKGQVMLDKMDYISLKCETNKITPELIVNASKPRSGISIEIDADKIFEIALEWRSENRRYFIILWTSFIIAIVGWIM